MKFLVISDAHLIKDQGLKVAYAPYVKEMDLWMSYVEETVFVCPNKHNGVLLSKAFKIQKFKQVGLRRLEFHKFQSAIVSLLSTPYQAVVLWNQMRKADHIHLRAPGNLVLLASFVQILFPRKRKTTKYAGNWDPTSKQPLSYRIQKWLLSNTFLTRNMQVLVYGEWSGLSKNIKPFFTASYYDTEKETVPVKNFKQPLRAVFVGTMGANKRPLETVQLVRELRKEGVAITLEMYGDGPAKDDIQIYLENNDLEEYIILRGNQPAHIVKQAYINAHLVILLSKSEGWPKAVAEAMFWGVVPISSDVSCVPWMLGKGKRGILINDPEQLNISDLKKKLESPEILSAMSKEAMRWSRNYTMDTFASEIEKLLQ